jgi:1-acyl-sn-glycerol-3-phosphate acyltransferase
MHDKLVPPSRWLLAGFAAYLHWYIGRHFRAQRLAHGERFPSTTGPLIIYLNHASWWDPLACITLSRHLMPAANHYAPMDATALEHYSIFRRMGLFPVEAGTLRGAAQFLSASREIVSSPNSVLWITPEGRFTDARVRPLRFEPGLAALVTRLESCTVVPMANEYTFWDERLPEILVNCGEPIRIESGRSRTAEEWNGEFATAMARTQDELQALATLRDPSLFRTVLSGRVGIGGVYEGWKRLLAVVSGRAYEGSHGSLRQ